MFDAREWQSKVVGCGTVLALAAGGCTAKDVSVGAEGAALNMNQCYATDCGTFPRTNKLSEAPLSVCAAAGSSYHVAMTQNYAQALCPARTAQGIPNCTFYQSGSGVAPDRSLWLLFGLRSPEPDVGQYWLQHYAEDGTIVGTQLVLEVPGDAFYGNRADLAVDQDGYAWVALYSVDAGPNADSEVHEAIWVGKYGVSALPVLNPIALQGIARPHLATAREQGIAIVGDAFGNANRGLMSLLDRGGSLLWTQTVIPTYGSNGGQGVTGVSMDLQGQVMVLSERDRTMNGNATFGLTRVAGDGRVVWDATLPHAFADARAALLLADETGRFVVAGALAENEGLPLGLQAPAFFGYAANGEQPWGWALDASFLGTPSIDRATGTVYVTDAILGGGTARARFAEIAPDGMSCVMHEIEGAYPLAVVARGSGSLYYIADDSIGRIEPDSTP